MRLHSICCYFQTNTIFDVKCAEIVKIKRKELNWKRERAHLLIRFASAVGIMFVLWELPSPRYNGLLVTIVLCFSKVWGIVYYVKNTHGFCIVCFTVKWEETDTIAKSNLKGSISYTAVFFFVPALNIINNRGAVGIVAGLGCVMANQYLVRFRFHKWKIQADLINVQEGCMTWGLYCSHNTRQIHSTAWVEVNLWAQMKIST